MFDFQICLYVFKRQSLIKVQCLNLVLEFSPLLDHVDDAVIALCVWTQTVSKRLNTRPKNNLESLRNEVAKSLV